MEIYNSKYENVVVTVRKLHVKLNVFLRFVGFDRESEEEKKFRPDNIKVTIVLVCNFGCQFRILLLILPANTKNSPTKERQAVLIALV
jgi:uncharacterized protein YutD